MSKLPKANKELGQHFLKDQNVIEKITHDWHDECDVIIEVGPGPAILTKILSSHDKPLYLIEKDLRFKDLLLECVPENRLFLQDALTFNWKEFVEKENLQNKKIWLVSNLPYNVGTLLFVQFLQVEQIRYMSLMFQKEVGDKTYLGQQKNQTNGLLSLSLNYFQSKRLIKVPPGCFSPPPKVDSVVVSYKRVKTPLVSITNFENFNQFTRLCFSQKRKQLQSVLKGNYSFDRLQNAFEQAQVSPQIRAEALSFEQVIKLYKSLHQN